MVPMVVLLSDLWRRTDHQDTTLQRSHATTGGYRVWGEWERDSALHCRALSKWVFQPVNSKAASPLQQHPCQRTRLFLTLLAHPRQRSPCVVDWIPACRSENVDSNQLCMFSLVVLSSTLQTLWLLFYKENGKNMCRMKYLMAKKCTPYHIFPYLFSWWWLGSLVSMGNLFFNMRRRDQKSGACVQ